MFDAKTSRAPALSMTTASARLGALTTCACFNNGGKLRSVLLPSVAPMRTPCWSISGRLPMRDAAGTR